VKDPRCSGPQHQAELELRALFEQFVADLRSRGTKPRLRVMVKMEESRAKIAQSLSRYGNRRQWRDLYPPDLPAFGLQHRKQVSMPRADLFSRS
jgi:hypothetical protein